MSDAKTIAALQRNLTDAEVERLRLVEEGLRHVDRIAELEAQLAAAVAAEREACACADDFNGVTADDLRAAIRARGGEVARETECRCGHSHAAHKGTGYSCLGSASPRESCDCRLFVKRGGK